MHFERSYQELWRKHVEIKRPNDGVVYNEFSRLTMNEWNALKLVTNETVRLRNKTSLLFYFAFAFA